MINKFLYKLKFTKWKDTGETLTSKDNVFTLSFPPNWSYSKSRGKNFYTFISSDENFKGALNLSIVYNKPIAINSSRELATYFLNIELKESNFVEYETPEFSVIILKHKDPDSNMNNVSYFGFNKKITFHFKFIIFEEVKEEEQNRWLEVSHIIIYSMKVNLDIIKN